MCRYCTVHKLRKWAKPAQGLASDLAPPIKRRFNGACPSSPAAAIPIVQIAGTSITGTSMSARSRSASASRMTTTPGLVRALVRGLVLRLLFRAATRGNARAAQPRPSTKRAASFSEHGGGFPPQGRGLGRRRGPGFPPTPGAPPPPPPPQRAEFPHCAPPIAAPQSILDLS